MNLLPALMGRFGYVPKRAARGMYARGWKAAAQDRLSADWQTASLSADGELRGKLVTLRARSRDLWMNDDYAAKYIAMVSTNVIGSGGVVLQNKAMDIRNGADGKPVQTLDEAANRAIEDAWWAWGEKYCESTGTMNFLALQKLVIETVARDGEIFIRKIKGFDNPFRFTLQVLEADFCPADLEVEQLRGGNRVVMGVELDKWSRPAAYYFTARNPVEGSPYLYFQDKYLRVPAEEVIHVFLKSRSSQTRGWPWMATAMSRLKMLGAYEESEVIAARAGACKMGFFTKAEGEDKYVGDTKDAEGVKVSEFEPGLLEELPAGLDFKGYDPQHPNSNFGIFTKSVLRGIAAGLNVSYNALANDLESTSYSSGRIGVLEERDNWRSKQQWIISTFHGPVFEPWLNMALLTGNVRLPIAKYDKFNQPTWHPRGWAWVDPSKDSAANIGDINFGLKTRTETLAEMGKDFTEHLAQLVTEKQAIEAAGLVFSTPGQTVMPDKGQDDGGKPAGGNDEA